MAVLAFDTSTAACSAAVSRGGALLARRFQMMPRGQSEALMPMIVATMEEAAVAFAALEAVAVTVGPGAFTGLRIGLAAARGIALAAGLPLAGLLTTEAIAQGTAPEERRGRTLWVVVDAKRADVFAQPFDEDLAPLDVVRGMLPEELAAVATGPVLVAGDGAQRVLGLLREAVESAAPGVPDAARFIGLAERRWRDGMALPPVPVYLRPPDVTL